MSGAPARADIARRRLLREELAGAVADMQDRAAALDQGGRVPTMEDIAHLRQLGALRRPSPDRASAGSASARNRMPRSMSWMFCAWIGRSNLEALGGSTRRMSTRSASSCATARRRKRRQERCGRASKVHCLASG